jgi:hypothetical protein
MTAASWVRDDHTKLLDALACRTLQETYSFAEITRNPDLFASVWTEDARFGRVQGRDAIRQTAIGFFKTMEPISELRVSLAGWHVDVAGDVAHGQFYIVSQLKIPQPDGTSRILHMDAGYRTDFERTKEGWRIARMGGIKNPDDFHDTAIKAQLAYEDVSFEA